MSENYGLLLNDDKDQSIITSALELAKNQLYSFANSSDFQTKMQLAFGVAVDSNSFQIAWQNQDFSVIPNIQILSGTELGEAIGAYAQATNTIYLSQDYLNQNSNNIASITSLLLEEIGHAVDAKINILDASGDEGAIFSGVVQSKIFEPEQIQQLKAKDDYTTITLDGQIVQIEQASISDSGGEGGTNKTIQLDPLPSGQTNKGSVTVNYSYEHYSIPDQFTIRYDGNNIFDTGGLVSGSKTGTVTFTRGNSNVIEVKVTAPREGTAWDFSVTAEPCADTTPLKIEAVGGDFKDNDADGDCEFNGTVTIGRTDGTAKLIRVEGGTVEYDDKEVRVTNGTIFSLIGNVSAPLFQGSFTVPFSSARSSSFNDSGSAANEFKLAGLDVEFKSIFIDKNDIKFGTEFSLPEDITGSAVKVTLDSSFPNPDALIINSNGVKLGFSGKVKFPDPGKFKLKKLVEVEASNLSISYSASDDTLKLQGKLSLSKFTKSKETTIEADLSDNNFIQIRDGKVDARASISVKNVDLPGDWGLDEAKITLDTTSDPGMVGGEVGVTFPWGRSVPPKTVGAKLGMDFTINPVNLDGVSAGVTLPDPGVPIGSTGIFLNSVNGSIKNFAPANQAPIEFEGGVGLSGGPKLLGASLISADLTVKINPNELTGTGKLTIIDDKIANANGSANVNWNEGFLQTKSNFSILDGTITTNSGFKVTSAFNINFGGSAAVNIPNFVPLVGGKSIASGNYAFDFSNNGNFADDFAAGWGQFSIIIPLIGTGTVTAGVKGFFDGRFELIGARNIPETNSFDILPGTEWMILSADWENANPNTRVRIKTPSGTFIDEADFAANNFAIVDEFTDNDTRAVAIPNPIPGIWDIIIVDPTGLGTIDYNGIRDSVAPAIQITSPASDITTNGTVNIGFNALDSDSTANIKLFYDDDNTGLDGILIADNLAENDGAGSFTWNTEGVPTGDYFVYAMIMDDENVPVFSSYSPGKIKITESADLSVDKVINSGTPVTDGNFTYRLTVKNDGTSTSKEVVVTDSLPSEVTFISASITPSQQSGNDLTFNLGDISIGETRSVDIVVKAPATATTIYNTASVVSKTFDPSINNNASILVTSIEEPSVALADLSLSVAPNNNSFKIGDQLTYDFTITNNGTNLASGVTFNSFLTSGLQNVTTTKGVIGSDIVTANLGNLNPGQSTTISITGDVTTAGTLTSTASVEGDQTDSNALNNSLIVQRTVSSVAPTDADLELSLNLNKPTADIGAEVTLQLTLTNKGIGAATAIQIKYLLPQGLRFISSSPQQGTYDAITGIWNAGNVAKDNTASLDITATVESVSLLTSTAEIIAVNETDPDSTANNNNPNEDDQASVTLNAALAIPTLAKTADDIFTIFGGSGNPKLQVTLAGRNSNLVNELGVFTVDDAQGKINGIAPGETGYTQAALNKSKVIFSTIANVPNGFDINNLTSLIEFESGNNLRFLLVKNGTIDSVQNGNTPTSDILFSDLSRQKITDLGTDGFSLAWKDGSNNDTDFKDLVVNIKSTNDPLPLGTNLQGKQQGEVLDLRGITNNVKADFVVNREAAFNNFVGFYKVADENGGIDVDADGTIDFRPGDSGYAQAAIKNRVAGIDLRVDNQGTASFTDKTLTGGSIFAPFILTNGRTVDQVLNGQVDQAYFAYIGANADKVDHIRLLGNNVFGFEDLAGGGDKDYNDVVLKVNLSVV